MALADIFCFGPGAGAGPGPVRNFRVPSLMWSLSTDTDVAMFLTRMSRFMNSASIRASTSFLITSFTLSSMVVVGGLGGIGGVVVEEGGPPRGRK